MNNGPLISIIVPTYNAAPYLTALCDSILAQTYGNFEALFYDDGSTDDSLKALKRYEGDARFRIIRGERNRGVNAATNELFKIFRGEFWCHPGADDVLLPEFLERRLASMQTNPHATIVHGPPAAFIDEAGEQISSSEPCLPPLPKTISDKDALELMLQHNVIATSSVMVRSVVTRQVVRYFQTDWRYAQDWYLWLLHTAWGGELVWDETPLHLYRVHRASLTNNPQKEAVRKAEIRLVPMTALSASASYSAAGGELWKKWKMAFYALWLVRAISLRRKGQLDSRWLDLARVAYYGKSEPRSVIAEVVRFAPAILANFIAERKMRRRQVLRVSGLAQINHPVFQITGSGAS